MALLSKVLGKVVFAASEQRDQAHLQFHSATGCINRKLLVVLGTSSIYATYQVPKNERFRELFCLLVCLLQGFNFTSSDVKRHLHHANKTEVKTVQLSYKVNICEKIENKIL